MSKPEDLLEAVHDEGYDRGLADAERVKNGLSPNRYNPYRSDRRGDGCRQLALIAQRDEAIRAAKAAFAALPEGRRAKLSAHFDLAALEAEAHATYMRRG